MFNRCEHPKVVRVGLKILYRNPRRPGEAGIKLVPDQSQKAAEREILERLGFTVIEMTLAPGQGLVEQQHLRADCQRAAERDALPLTAGKGGYLALPEPV